MGITTTTNNGITRIIIDDKFDYSVHNDFRAVYKDTPVGTQFIVDMNRTTYIDSSALGMMLLLREHSGEKAEKISIVGCNPEVKQILVMSNFEHLFNIS